MEKPTADVFVRMPKSLEERLRNRAWEARCSAPEYIRRLLTADLAARDI